MQMYGVIAAAALVASAAAVTHVSWGQSCYCLFCVIYNGVDPPRCAGYTSFVQCILHVVSLDVSGVKPPLQWVLLQTQFTLDSA